MTDRATGQTLASMETIVCGVDARTGNRVAVAAYLGGGDVFDRALVEFAEGYADQNELDFEAFVAAVDSGRLAAVTGV